MKDTIFSTAEYLQICLTNERATLQHLIGAAKSGNQPLDNPIIKNQKDKISKLIIKIENLEKQNERQ
tara:strand:- start:424 stop:624 length:201 start_codon:yes stop_codon:yes gene_type:complete